MCGIIGVIGPRAFEYDLSIGLKKLHHRGPDAHGSEKIDLGWTKIQLGVTRLNIVDQREVQVPLRSGNIVLAYNGEIYNWRQLRKDIGHANASWKSHCDSEVVAKAWELYGDRTLAKFNGMFAFCVVDIQGKKITLVRDRAGEKPLFFAQHDGHVFFASEIKALPIPLEEVECLDQKIFEFDCREATPFKNIWRLNPGCLIELRNDHNLARLKQTTWWAPPEEVDESISFEEAADLLEEYLVDAIRIRLPNEVGSTILVSGGLDSAISQAVAWRPKVYCCHFGNDGILDEAQMAGLGAEVIPVTFDLDLALKALPEIAYHLDTPATWSALAHWFLAKKIHEDGFRVVLSGEGADEIFGGYSKYRLLFGADNIREDRNLKNYGPSIDYLFGSSVDIVSKLVCRDPSLLEKAKLLVKEFSREGRSAAEICSRLDWKTTLCCLLRMADRMTAAWSLENRSPFFDYRVIELGFKLPMNLKITNHESKHILREVARRVGVPRQIIDCKNKRGLVVPWNTWRQATGIRGTWDRSDFSQEMLKAWRVAFNLGEKT